MGKENNISKISKMISELVTQKVRLDGAKSELEDDLQVQRYLGTCTEIDKTSDKLKETLEKASTNEIVGILYLLMSKRNELIGELEDRIREENGEAAGKETEMRSGGAQHGSCPYADCLRHRGSLYGYSVSTVINPSQ